ncbi:MAG: hypothetical protein NC226_07340 [Bacteroides cellulosilyticus]|nr:hypothetical protein [Bacteroides cellulosilyticus]
MSAFIIITACLVCLDRMFFRRHLLSLFIDGLKALLFRRRTPGAAPEQAPAETFEPPALIISKRYMNGHTRTRAASAAAAEQSVKEAVIFAPSTAPASPQMRDWSELTLRPAIGEDGEIDDPEEPIPTADLPVAASPGMHDPKVASLLDTLEAGEQIVTGNATQEEMRAIENFDLRAYV